MKSCYFDQETRAMLDVDPPTPGAVEGDGRRRIPRVNVPTQHRGKGIGRALLKQCLDDADLEGVILTLEPSASGGLTTRELVAWYERNGFTWEGKRWQSPMVRYPVGWAFTAGPIVNNP